MKTVGSAEMENNSVDAGASPVASKHTSGPWHVVGPDPTKRNPHVGLWLVESDQINVANHCTYADARLIAAAPDLLAALKEVSRYDECFCVDTKGRGLGRCMWCDARAAIAKAEG